MNLRGVSPSQSSYCQISTNGFRASARRVVLGECACDEAFLPKLIVCASK